MKVGSALGKHYAQLFGLLMLVLMATGWAPAAQAAPNCQATSATLSMPATVVVQPDEDLGPIDGATGTATIIFNCSGLPASKAANDYTATIQAGQTLATLDSTNNTSGPGITFATNLNGWAVLVTATPVQATSKACLACGPTSTAGYVPGAVTAPSSAAVGSFSGAVTATYTAQLIKTKTTAGTGTISQNNLIPYWWYISGGSVNSTSQNLGANLVLPAIIITNPTCTVTGGNNQTVTLPTVETSQLSASGKTAGVTPFNIEITGCPNGFTVASNIFSGGTVDNNTGNLTNKTTTGNGGAKNVEVQLLNGPGSSRTGALNLSRTNTAANQNSGTFPVNNNAVTLNYFAQYYATGVATAGLVNATINYTITYQ
jgi:type 1 fimbria pilin